MSKVIKQMEMDVLKQRFGDVRDMVLLSASGLTALQDHALRSTLRKKQVSIQMVKNTLVRRVFGEMGITLGKVWDGPTMLAWGSTSLSDLSKEIDTAIKKIDKIKVKAAVADGQEVTFKQALSMPTKAEAIGSVLGLILSPAARLAAQIAAPAGNLAGQIKTLSEEKPAAEAAPAEAGAAVAG